MIGDVGGHLDELTHELAELGVPAPGAPLPPHLTVIQVGDLIHRGPDSAGVVRLVDGYLREQPRQWVQLAGNHEAQYLRAPAFDWPERLDDASAGLLRRWWSSGSMRVAATIETEDEEFLVTHAGLTQGFWREVLGSPPTAAETAAALNRLVRLEDNRLFRPGQMLTGHPQGDPTAGPLWAAAGTELVPSWLGVALPFSQVHGHTSVYDWERARFRTSPEVEARTDLDTASRHATVTLDGGRIVGVDAGHGLVAKGPWRAWTSPQELPGVGGAGME